MAEATKIADTERQKQEEQRRQIQDALNRQSYNEFRAYAEQQYPNNPDQQGILIRQLQEQHYYQYMQQVNNYVCNHRTSVVRVFSTSWHFFKTNVTQSVAELWSFSTKFGELRCNNVNNTLMHKRDFA